MPKKLGFSRSFDSEHIKGYQKQLKSAWQHFCHVFFINIGYIELEHVSLNDILNLGTDC